MATRRSLVTLILGLGLGVLLGVDPGVAQSPGVAQRSSPALDSARIAALQKLIHKHAASLKPEDISKLSSKTKPLAGPEQKDSGTKKKTDSITQSQSHSAKAENKTGHSTFLHQPHGHRPHLPTLPPGYHPMVRVAGPGGLDWTFVVSRQSLDPEPTAQTAGYISTRQSYELYVPPGYNPRHAWPLILHVSTAHRSDGWGAWQKTCQGRHVLLAGVHNAGNDVPPAARARIVLDVLDDVRRRFHIDPDRTYITGCSGAGHAASSIAFALPELFGGHIAICGAWNLRAEQMLRQRVSERLSIAILTGVTDFNRPELEREFYPILREQNVRSMLRVYPGMGHGCPNSAQLDAIFQWLEAGLPQRRLGAALFPASRLLGAPAPDEWSTAVVLEAAQRIEMGGGELSGLFELQAVVDRWRGLPAAAVAQKLLDEFDASSPVPWKQIYQHERMNFRYLQARTFDGIINSPPPPNYPVPRINLLDIAIALWQEIHDLAPASGAISHEAAARLIVLHREAGR